MKKISVVILAVLLAVAGFGVFKYWQTETPSIDAFNIIPADAIYIVEAQEPIENWREFSSSNIWNFLKSHTYMSELAANANYLDSLIQDNKNVLKLVGKRPLFISAHITQPDDYDFLFLIDLQQASKIDLLNTIVKRSINKNDFSFTEREYKTHSIIDLFDRETQDHLYISQVGNYMACSYIQDILIRALEQNLNEDYTISQKFVETQSRVDHAGIFKLYLNYNFIDDYIGLYTTLDQNIVKSLSSSFSYSGFDIEVNDEKAWLQGFTSLPDSVQLYSHLLQEYGNANFGFDKIISARTAYLQAIGINKFKQFYKEVLALRSKDSKNATEYHALRNRVEKILGLSLDEDILPWIGNEIVIAQNYPSNIHRQEDDLLVAIKTNDVGFAKEKLQLIQKRIKKRTPAKFKKMRYKTYDIYYLDIKGFFSVFFGEPFRKLTRPYYTILGDYILFSNSPKTLVSALEDYENNFVLAEYDEYKEVKNNIPNESTLFTYINGPLAYDVMSASIKANEKMEYAQNKPYFNYIKGAGLAYTAADQGFENTLFLHCKEDVKVILPENHAAQLTQAYLEDFSLTLRNLSEAETFVLNEVQDGEFIKYFNHTETIQLKAETDDGIFHGKYEEFYKNGNLRSTGKYRRGRKVGRWKYYNADGKLSDKNWEGL